MVFVFLVLGCVFLILLWGCIYFAWQLYLLGHSELGLAVVDEIVKVQIQYMGVYGICASYISGRTFQRKNEIFVTAKDSGICAGA